MPRPYSSVTSSREVRSGFAAIRFSSQSRYPRSFRRSRLPIGFAAALPVCR
jgi:hypothetical protein